MNFTDTHCHLADPALRENLPHIVRLETMLAHYPQAWVGEIGLDFYDKIHRHPLPSR